MTKKQRQKTKPTTVNTRLLNPRPRVNKKYRNRLAVTFETEIGEITGTFNFKNKKDTLAAFDALVRSYSVAGLSLFINGKFKGGQDGLGS